MNFQYFLKVQNIKKRLYCLPQLDFYVQTFILISGLVIALIGFNGPDWFLLLMLALGCWQMMSSFLSVVFRGPAFREKLKHFGASIMCILSLLAEAAISKVMNTGENPSKIFTAIAIVYFFVAPWTLAIYYYVITWRLAYPRHKKRSSFLPHINF